MTVRASANPAFKLLKNRRSRTSELNPPDAARERSRMGEPDERPQPIDTRLLRTTDLIDLRLEAPGCTIEPTDGGAELVAGPDASLVVHFPPQHLGEEVWQAGAPPPPPAAPAALEPRRRRAEPAGLRGSRGHPHHVHAREGARGAARPSGCGWRRARRRSGRPTDSGIEKPRDLETAIEAPYRLIVSPERARRVPARSEPQGPTNRPELWRTHLTVRKDDGTFDDEDDDQRIVRALWTRDNELPPPGFDQPLIPFDRTRDRRRRPTVATPRTRTRRWRSAPLSLSSLGAWFDWKQSWEFPSNIVDYRHQAYMGRDGYVRVAYPGILFPFGHRCFLVKITEREVKHRDTPVAYLWQRWFIIVRQPTRAYPPTDRDNPFGQVTISPLVTPGHRQAPGGPAAVRPDAQRRAVPVHADHGRPRRRDQELARAAGVRAGGQGRAADVRVPCRGRLAAVLPGAADPGARADALGGEAGQGRGHLDRGRAPDLRRRDRLAQRDEPPVPHRDARRSCRRCGTWPRRRPPSTWCSPSRTWRTAFPPARSTPSRCRERPTPVS